MLYTPLELIIELHRQYTRQNVVVLRKDVDDCIQRMIAGRRHPLRFLHKKIKVSDFDPGPVLPPVGHLSCHGVKSYCPG